MANRDALILCVVFDHVEILRKRERDNIVRSRSRKSFANVHSHREGKTN